MAAQKSDEIDAIMAEMEAKTPKIPEIKISQTFFQERIIEVKKEVEDQIDAKSFLTSTFQSKPKKPGELHPSRPTAEKYYDTSHKNIGTALIFNQVVFKNHQERKGSRKDAEDLKDVLLELGFDTEVFTDFTVEQIRNCLYSGGFKGFQIQLYRFTFSSFFRHSIKTRPQRKRLPYRHHNDSRRN